MKATGLLILIGLLAFVALHARPKGALPSITLSPTTVVQGDPVLVAVHATSSVSMLEFNGAKQKVFTQNGATYALLGIDLKFKSGSYPLVATLASGATVRANIVINNRKITVEPLGIPQSLGGNTPTGLNNLLSHLAEENKLLNSLTSGPTRAWTEPFRAPVADPVVTDSYGYSRSTQSTAIPHKGTDYHAPPGTPVYAMNVGKVEFAHALVAYGNTVVIDHGLGVQTLYMHLSQIEVKEGDVVTRGQEIGLSGQTGYAEGPHLHVSVKIDGVSIDPEAFLKLPLE